MGCSLLFNGTRKSVVLCFNEGNVLMWMLPDADGKLYVDVTVGHMQAVNRL